jgi:hypothetical protein
LHCLIRLHGCDFTPGAAERVGQLPEPGFDSEPTICHNFSSSNILPNSPDNGKKRAGAPRRNVQRIARRNGTNATPRRAIELCANAGQNLRTPKRQAKIADQAAKSVDFTTTLRVFAAKSLDRRDFERIFQRFLGFCGLLFRFGRF